MPSEERPASYDPETHDRRSIRLKGYDYSQAGAYFVTLVARDRSCLFGSVVDGVVRLNDAGRLVRDLWEWLAARYPYVTLDEYVVMPSHLHGIIAIANQCRGGSRTAQTLPRRQPLGRMIGAFKTVSTKRLNLARETPGRKVWQRNYYERVIRNDEELTAIREYIVNNPVRWELDKYNPETRSKPTRPDSRGARQAGQDRSAAR